MDLHAFLARLLTEFLVRHVEESTRVAAAEELTAIVAFGLEMTEESLQQASCEALREQFYEARRCVIEELLHPPSN